MNHFELKQLLGAQREPCVSIYLPTQRGGQADRKDALRLENQLREASVDLHSFFSHPSRIQNMLGPAWDLVEHEAFWREASDGLAIFITPNGLRFFREPVAMPERVVVGRRFHVRPLLPLVVEDGRYYVLALSPKRVRLLEGDRSGLHVVRVPGLPGSLEEALGAERDEKSLQFHTGTPAGGGKRPAVYHGQGKGVDDKEAELQRYFGLIDEHVACRLRTAPAPLVVAAVERNIAAFRQISRVKTLQPKGVKGNPDSLTAEQLHAKAWPLIQRTVLHEDREEAARRLEEGFGSGRASRDLEQIVHAARQGRVDTLFVDVRSQAWGQVDPTTETVEIRAEPDGDTEDLLDIATAETLLRDGTVYAAPGEELPTTEPAAAVFRY